MICEGPAGCGLHVGVRSLVDERPTHAEARAHFGPASGCAMPCWQWLGFGLPRALGKDEQAGAGLTLTTLGPPDLNPAPNPNPSPDPHPDLRQPQPRP
jgi:hypothetical protein